MITDLNKPSQLVEQTRSPEPVVEFDVSEIGSLAYDLAYKTAPLSIIADTYGLEMQELGRLIRNNHELRSTIAQIKKNQVPSQDSGFTHRILAVADQSLPQIANIMQDPRTKAETKVATFKTMLTHLTTVEKNKITAKNGGDNNNAVQVVFNVDPGIRGIHQQPVIESK